MFLFPKVGAKVSEFKVTTVLNNKKKIYSICNQQIFYGKIVASLAIDQSNNFMGLRPYSTCYEKPMDISGLVVNSSECCFSGGLALFTANVK